MTVVRLRPPFFALCLSVLLLDLAFLRALRALWQRQNSDDAAEERRGRQGLYYKAQVV